MSPPRRSRKLPEGQKREGGKPGAAAPQERALSGAATPNVEVAAEFVAISCLQPWDRNPRVNDHAVEKVAQAILRFGFTSPIIARPSDGRIMAGHTRYKAAQKLGLEKVPVRWIELDDDKAAQYTIADNKLAELAYWDDTELARLLDEQAKAGADILSLGFDPEEIDQLIKSLTETTKGNTDPDQLPEKPTTRAKRGELWLLGRHRLYVGDCTDPSARERLMGGRLADMVFTDPPYGLAYIGKTKDALTIENDKMEEATFVPWLTTVCNGIADVIRKGAGWYICSPAGDMGTLFRIALKESKLKHRQTIVWVKDHFVLGRMDFHWRHEDILYGWEEGGAHFFIDRKQDTVWEVARPVASREHPTMKPVELVERAFEVSSRRGDLVVDFFLGSGTTLIAAEKTGRTCYGIELDEKYADVILARWEEFTGRAAVLADATPLEEQ